MIPVACKILRNFLQIKDLINSFNQYVVSFKISMFPSAEFYLQNVWYFSVTILYETGIFIAFQLFNILLIT
jgi:hypothetical protein